MLRLVPLTLLVATLAIFSQVSASVVSEAEEELDYQYPVINENTLIQMGMIPEPGVIKARMPQRKKATEDIVLPFNGKTGEPIWTGRIIVKFMDDVRARAPRTPSDRAISMNRANIGQVDQIITQYNGTIQQYINRPPEVLAQLEQRALLNSGWAQPDLAGMMFVDVAEEDMVATARALNDLDYIEYVHIDTELILFQCGDENCGTGPAGEGITCNAPNFVIGNPGNCTVLDAAACDNADCLAAVAEVDPECTAEDWDNGCVAIAWQVCTRPVENPQPENGCDDPEVPVSEWGCLDGNCCDLVGEILPRCVDEASAVGWDQVCAAIANMVCTATIYNDIQPDLGWTDRYDPCLSNLQTLNPEGTAPGVEGFVEADGLNPALLPVAVTVQSSSCFETHEGSGCNQPKCCTTVCFILPECCGGEWDQQCVNLATSPELANQCQSGSVEEPTPTYSSRLTDSGELPGGIRETRGRQAYTHQWPVVFDRNNPNPAMFEPENFDDFAHFLEQGWTGGGFGLSDIDQIYERYLIDNNPDGEAELRGEGIKVGVIEFAAFINHEDFTMATPHGPDGTGGTPLEQPKVIAEEGQTILFFDDGYLNHGTACLGMIVAADNGFGVTGIAHNAQGYFFPTLSLEEGSRLQNAIVSAALEFGPGDILSYSIGSPPDENGEQQTLPTNPGNWTVLRLASDLGITNFISAGNDCVPVGPEAGSEDRPRCGAIIVGAIGAGQGAVPFPAYDNPFSRMDFSSFDNEDWNASVDCCAWGTAVCTTGYGNLFRGANPQIDSVFEVGRLREYTHTMNGTSSACPMAAGLAACIQPLAKEVYGVAFPPDNPTAQAGIEAGGMMQIMRSNGSAAQSIDYDNPLRYTSTEDSVCNGDTLFGEEVRNIGVFPNARSCAVAVFTSGVFAIDPYDIKVIWGTLVEGTKYSLAQDDLASLKIAGKRADVGEMRGVHYILPGMTTDVEVSLRTGFEPEEFAALSMEIEGRSTIWGIVALPFIKNHAEDRWELLAVELLWPYEVNFEVELPATVDPAFYLDENGEVTLRLVTHTWGHSKRHEVHWDLIDFTYSAFGEPPGDDIGG
ncbi:MAG: hypothetical protein CMJ32_07625 [Phycisphaerae bacterium]|nr:hypothetical protein [Phycisphaerae bacterium]